MYKYSSMDSFARGSANDNDVTDENRYCRKEISTVKSQTGAESIAELNNQTMQSPGQWAFVRIGLGAVMQVGLSPSWGESPLDKAYSQDNSRQIGHHQMTSEGKCQKKICRTDFWDFGDFEEEINSESLEDTKKILRETRTGYTFTPNYIGIFRSYISKYVDQKSEIRKEIGMNKTHFLHPAVFVTESKFGSAFWLCALFFWSSDTFGFVWRDLPRLSVGGELLSKGPLVQR